MERILISRTDSIGDVILTLPLCGLLKEHFPQVQIDFLGRNYTKSIIEHCNHISSFYDLGELNFKDFPVADTIIHVFPNKEIARAAAKKKIPARIGTSHRIYHWFTCNKLVNLGRKNSDLHEARLNLELLKPLGLNNFPKTSELWKYYGWQVKPDYPAGFLDNNKFNLVFHIKSKGSAKEWESKKYLQLAKRLDPERFQIIITGTRDEGDLINKEIAEIFDLPHVTDTTGQFTLDSLIDLIGNADGIVAASTGPLHIGAASGIHALGLYPFDRPMHAGRWAPIGKKAVTISEKSSSNSSALNISVEEVQKTVESWIN